jgi:hypothetical protein
MIGLIKWFGKRLMRQSSLDDFNSFPVESMTGHFLGFPSGVDFVTSFKLKGHTTCVVVIDE